MSAPLKPTRTTPEAFTTAADAHRAASTHTKRGSRRRTRAAGAGHPHSLGLRTRLLLALVWLRVYPTYELFGLDRSNAWHNAQDVLEVLDTMPDSPFDHPDPDRRRLQTAGAVRRSPRCG